VSNSSARTLHLSLLMTLPQLKFRSSKKQLSFFENLPRSHGGSQSLGKRKTFRPVDTKQPLHLVLHSDLAKQKLALVNYNSAITKIISRMAERFKISIYEINVNFNHIHLLVHGKQRKNLQDFFRSIAALIARKVTGAKKGKPFGRFWSYLLFSRIVNGWKKDFEYVRNYIIKNTHETLGLISYQRDRAKKIIKRHPV